uniref:Uncharacterized protein n=1 Tax=Palpitomonas bilix TaxID=652834 RepID=A0A7S3D374_9EUKA
MLIGAGTNIVNRVVDAAANRARARQKQPKTRLEKVERAATVVRNAITAYSKELSAYGSAADREGEGGGRGGKRREGGGGDEQEREEAFVSTLQVLSSVKHLLQTSWSLLGNSPTSLVFFPRPIELEQVVEEEEEGDGEDRRKQGGGGGGRGGREGRRGRKVTRTFEVTQVLNVESDGSAAAGDQASYCVSLRSLPFVFVLDALKALSVSLGSAD